MEINNVRNIDDVSQAILQQMDYSESEIIYKSEIDSQVKIYTFMFILGIFLILGSLVL